ncbi:hypothetical protein JXR93_10030 [bacterium]|nr:hypothetical protein [bacterium]
MLNIIKTSLFFTFFFSILILSSCDKIKDSSQKTINQAPPAGKTQKDTKIVSINRPKNIDGTKYSFKNLTFYLDNSFIKKDEKNYFGEQGINISIDIDSTSLSAKDYSEFVFNTIQKEYPRYVLFEEESFILNGVNSFKVTHIFDKIKYLIQQETIIIPNNSDIYIFTITGKKQDIEQNKDKINLIFSTIEIQNI